jgi:hypothetical protein
MRRIVETTLRKAIPAVLLFLAAAHAVAQTHSLSAGWNLVGNDRGAAVDPIAVFGNATAPNSAGPNVATVWTWDSSLSKWNFFAPSLTPQALSTYAASKGYGVLTAIAQGEGFWVNAGSAVSINLSAALPTTYALRSTYQTFIATALTKSFTISGTCSGSGSRTTSPGATNTTFEGVTGFSMVSTLTMSFSNCTPASIAQTSTSYYDSNGVPLGLDSPGVNYGVYLTPLTIPDSITVGATAVLGTETFYTDSSKTVGNGRLDMSYTVTAETATTAIVNLIGKLYNAAGTLTATEQDKYRITTGGALTPVSADIQYANGSTTHLILTYY